MPEKIDHKGHEIITETKLIVDIIKFIILFPVNLSLYFSGKIDRKELFFIFYEFGHFFKDAYITHNLIIITSFVFLLQGIALIIWQDTTFSFFVVSPENIYKLNFLSVFTATFLHGSIFHLLGNMFYLFIFGRVVEKYLGSRQMLIIYLVGGIIANGVSAGLFGITGLGASGAISGVVAAAILIRPFYLSYLLIYPLPIFILGFFQITGDFSGFFNQDPNSNIGHIAHLAGYGSIAITVFFLNREKRKEMKKGLLINILFLLIFILLNSFFYS